MAKPVNIVVDPSTITDEAIVEASTIEKRKHYRQMSLDLLVVDPIEFLHHSLDVCCHVYGIDHMASARVRDAMVKALDAEPGVADMVRRVGGVIGRAHEHGQLPLF